MRPEILLRGQLRPVTGSALVVGAMVIIAFNALFPRVDNPWTRLPMMVENQTMRQVSFLAVTVGSLAIMAGLVGTALFAVAAGLRMAATGAAVEWAGAGSNVTGTEYAVAAALNHADDGVWFLSIITYWGGLGLLGAAMVTSQTFPRWLGVWILVVGFASATLVGVPLAFGVQAPARFLVFAALGTLTALWALVTGVWVLRRLG